MITAPAPLRRGGAVLALGLIAGSLPAHGGMYRGPGAGPPGGPSTPGPAVPGTPGGGPATAPRTLGGSSAWQTWWGFNKDRFLKLREHLRAHGVVTGSDEFYLGAGMRPRPRDTVTPTLAQKRDVILPALLRALDTHRNRDIVTACLVALGKIGPVEGGPDPLPAITARLGRSDQEIRETAALALGIHGDPAAFETLHALFADTAGGRRLVDRGTVGERTRAFAAYSLGLLARRSRDHGFKERIFDLLSARLADPRLEDRDLSVALVHGLGLLDPEGADSALGKRLSWRVTAALWAWYDRDLGKGEQLLQAHVPIAVARLLGRGDGVGQRRAIERLRRELGDRARHNAIHQSAAIALGRLAVPGDGADDQGASAALRRYWREGRDQNARRFALMALGRIGGPANRTRLLGIHAAANEATERPWAALALGLIGHRHRVAHEDQGLLDDTIGTALERDLRQLDNRSAIAATALALGLCRWTRASEEIQARVPANSNFPATAGHLCMGLALMDDETGIGTIRRALDDARHKAVLLRQAAIALGRLGDRRITENLHGLLAERDSVAALGPIARALGFIGDRRSVDPLVRMLGDPEIAKLGRAFAAAALGGIADKDDLPWNLPLAEDSNYRAAVDTLVNGSTGVLDIL